MRTVLTLAASVVINVTALAVMEWNVTQAQLPPAGEVTIVQMEGGQIEETTPVVAQAAVDSPATYR